MIEPTRYGYLATPALIARAAACSANDDRGEIAREEPATAGATRLGIVADDAANEDVPPSAFPPFPLRSVPKWVPAPE